MGKVAAEDGRHLILIEDAVAVEVEPAKELLAPCDDGSVGAGFDFVREEDGEVMLLIRVVTDSRRQLPHRGGVEMIECELGWARQTEISRPVIGFGEAFACGCPGG